MTTKRARGEGVFVSYSRSDLKFVEPVVRLLRIRNKSWVFFDRDSIAPGTDWAIEIAHGIDRSALFVLFWCAHSKDSKEVRKEWNMAIEARAQVVPVILDDTPLPRPVARFEWVDFREAAKVDHIGRRRRRPRGRARTIDDMASHDVSPSLRLPHTKQHTHHMLLLWPLWLFVLMAAFSSQLIDILNGVVEWISGLRAIVFAITLGALLTITIGVVMIRLYRRLDRGHSDRHAHIAIAQDTDILGREVRADHVGQPRDSTENYSPKLDAAVTELETQLKRRIVTVTESRG